MESWMHILSKSKPVLLFSMIFEMLFLSAIGMSYSLALPEYKEVKAKVAKDPDDLLSRYLLGKYYAKMGEYEKAILQWKRVVKLRPKLWKIFNRIGLLRYKMGNRARSVGERILHWKKALRIWRYVHRSNPRDEWSLRAFYNLRTKLRLLEGRQPLNKEGVSSSNRGSGLGLSVSSAREARRGTKLNRRGIALRSPLHTNRSFSHFFGRKRVAALSRDDLDELAASAYKSYCEEHYKDAARKYQLLSRKQTGEDRKDSLFYLGKCYLKDAENPDKALQTFRAYRDSYGENCRILFEMGKAFGLLGQFKNQIECYKKSLRFEAKNPDVHFHLALAYDRANETSKILKHVRIAVKKDPKYKKRLQRFAKHSNIAEELGGLFEEVLEETENSELSDEEIAEFARRVNAVLGEERLIQEPSLHYRRRH